MSKILLGLAILFTLLSAVLGYLTKSKITDLHSSVDAANASKAAATQQLSKAQGETKAAQLQVTSLTEQAQTSGKAVTDAQAALDAANKDKEDVTKQLADAKTQNQTLSDQVAKLTAQTTGTTAATMPPEQAAKIAEMETKVKEDAEIKEKLTQENATLQSRIDDFTKDRETKGRQAMARQLTGEVLAVQPSWNFVIISLGDRQGVTMNAPLIVRRGPIQVAKLKVTSVEPATSVADIISSSVPHGMQVMPGDRVIYTGVGP